MVAPHINSGLHWTQRLNSCPNSGSIISFNDDWNVCDIFVMCPQTVGKYLVRSKHFKLNDHFSVDFMSVWSLLYTAALID